MTSQAVPRDVGKASSEGPSEVFEGGPGEGEVASRQHTATRRGTGGGSKGAGRTRVSQSL